MSSSNSKPTPRRVRTSRAPLSGVPRPITGRGPYAAPSPYASPSQIGSYLAPPAFTNPMARAVAPTLGGAAGLYLGGIPGMAAGITAGGAFNKIAGLGAYSVSSNTLLTADQVPVMHSFADGFRIIHREFIQDISSSVLFTLTSFPLNPGVATTFPWLSNIASNFEQYNLHGCVFFFKSTSADALNSTNTALGTIVMAADYNSASNVPINKQQMEQSMWAVSSKPSESFAAPVECAPNANPVSTMYIRSASAGTNTDLRFTDLCRLDLATVGSQAAAVVGELWVSYDVTLSKPVLSYGAPSTVYGAHYFTNTAIANGTPLGTQAKTYDNMNLTISPTTITFPAQITGKFMVTLAWIGAGVTTVEPTLTYTNCTALSLLTGSTVSHYFWIPAVGGLGCLQQFTVSVPVSAAVSTVALSAATINTTSCEIFIEQMNQSVA